jgi:hypothetical protein
MFVPFSMTKCPACEKGVDIHFLNITSLIGPAEVRCWGCGDTVKTERLEWQEMPALGKVWFLAVSLLYAVLGYFLGGLSTQTALDFLEKRRWRSEWALHEPAFQIGGVAWATFIVSLQLYRVFRSMKRGRAVDPGPVRGSLWTLEVCGQLKILILLLLIPALCWCIAWLSR